ncbi:MAG: bifunctional hydroxymethylpyrimidine kinase/phosphomethylpyrimidine kinase [Desulfovibrionaceae bacterium]|nr:bifunctional hydroxymethylpyrimidine kinase/phosphomethylpyrimidine kinase [Desulfovibrionaceae bacterium]
MFAHPNVLTIAGADSGAGAGMQADLKTIQALGGYGLAVVTALTAQNGARVAGIFPASPEFVLLQLQTIKEGFPLASAKTGMLFSAEIIHVVSQFLADTTFPLVVDPVAVSQSGAQLLQDSAVECLKAELLPRCDVLTPNIPETTLLTGIPISDEASIFEAGKCLLESVRGAVIIKGGHLTGPLVTDYLFTHNAEPQPFSIPRLICNNNHGTGCSFSAVLATCLALGDSVKAALAKAQTFLTFALKDSYNPGKGAGPLNHAFAFEELITKLWRS